MTDTPSAVDALKPCPFCGGDAERFECEETDNIGGDVIGCKKCGASTRVFFGEKEGVEDAWNTRASAPRKVEEPDPDCVTLWKCNGPHIEDAEKPRQVNVEETRE